jgi:hypothetical protein
MFLKPLNILNHLYLLVLNTSLVLLLRALLIYSYLSWNMFWSKFIWTLLSCLMEASCNCSCFQKIVVPLLATTNRSKFLITFPNYLNLFYMTAFGIILSLN